MRPSDESHLIQQARSGDHAAISEIYRRHVERIYRYVRYRVGDDILAEDITADVFVRALESLRQYDDRGVPLIAWLYRIASARVIDHWRMIQRRQTTPLEQDDREQELADDSEADGLDILDRQALLQTVRELTDDQQSVIVLRFFQEMTTLEVAKVLGKTEGAVKALQRRALETLARRLKE